MFRIISKTLKNQILKIKNRFRRPTLEILWSQIYRDTIRDREWLEKLSVSPGRAAANYSFLFLIVRILSDFKPKSILEIGLGQSSKVVSAFLFNELANSRHVVVEGSQDWIDYFVKANPDLGRSEIVFLPHETKQEGRHQYVGYQGIENLSRNKYDLYLVDGPTGGGALSRFDLMVLLQERSKEDDFVIVVDNYERKGERRMVELVLKDLRRRGFKISTAVYSGSNDQFVIATTKFQYATSL